MSKLIIIPTPIGNLEDITIRSLRMLKECDFILAEDTRTTRNLLNHFNIEKRIIAYHKFNEHKTLPQLIDQINLANSVALVSDAGTPSISDPGFLIVRECIKNNIIVDCLPGATALIPALVNSGFPSDRFCFEGFLPLKKGRHTRLTELAEEKRSIIFYESPHRIENTIKQLAEYFGEDRQISLSREITKIYEETIRGTISEIIEMFSKKAITIKGEFVIVIAAKD